MPDYHEHYGGEYFKAANLDKPKIVTVASARLEEVGQEKKKKIVLRFEEADKGVVCNETRCNAMAEIAKSSNYDDWAGHRITLTKGRTTFGAKLVDCIEIQPTKVGDAVGDEIPF